MLLLLWCLIAISRINALATVCDFTWGSYFLLFTTANGFVQADGSVLCSQYVPGANYPFFFDNPTPAYAYQYLAYCIAAGNGVTFPGVGPIFWFNANTLGSDFCFQIILNGGVVVNNCNQAFGVGGLLCERPNTVVVSFSATQTQVLTTTSFLLVRSSTSTTVKTIAFLTGSTSTSVIVIGTTESFTQTRNILTFSTTTLSSIVTLSSTTTLISSSLQVVTSSLTLSETSFVTVTQLLIEPTSSTLTTLTTSCLN